MYEKCLGQSHAGSLVGNLISVSPYESRLVDSVLLFLFFHEIFLTKDLCGRTSAVVICAIPGQVAHNGIR